MLIIECKIFRHFLLTTYISNTLSTTPSTTGFWWGASSVNNSYYTEQAAYFGTPYNTVSSAPTTQRIKKTYTAGLNTRTVEYLRSTHDGMTIDFDLTDYLIASQNTTIKSFSQLNDSVGNEDFEFNAILVYYDVYDPAPNAVAGTEPVSVSNLYGVYFLNKVVQSGSEFIIPMITKNKPDTINKTNGNSFAFKVNLKFDTSIEDVSVEKSINDYSFQNNVCAMIVIFTSNEKCCCCSSCFLCLFISSNLLKLFIAVEGVIIPALSAALPKLFVSLASSFGAVSLGDVNTLFAKASTCLFLAIGFTKTGLNRYKPNIAIPAAFPATSVAPPTPPKPNKAVPE